MKVIPRYATVVSKHIVVIVAQDTVQFPNLKPVRSDSGSQLSPSYFVYRELTGVTRFLLYTCTE